MTLHHLPTFGITISSGLDQQANATTAVGVRITKDMLTIYDIFFDNKKIDDVAMKMNFKDLFLIPSSADFVSALSKLTVEMIPDILLLELIEQTKEILKKYGLKKKTMYMYQSYGFNPNKRYYDKHGQSIYSENFTWKFVTSARKQYENGEINTAKFQCIRRTAMLLRECYNNKEVTWRPLPLWTTTKLTPPF